MRKIFSLIFIALNFFCQHNLKVYADDVMQEVVLEQNVQSVSVFHNNEGNNENKDESLRDKLQNIYHLQIDNYEKPNFLLKEVLTKNYNENSLVSKTHFWAAYNGDIGLHFVEDSLRSEHTTNHYDINAINVGYDIYFKDNSADARIMLNYNPFLERNFAQNLFADMYIATNKIPHHRLIVGNSRPPVGVEGGMSPYVLPFIARSQISRNFGTVRKLGARINGNYSLVDYDLGIYSSDTYFQEFFPGAEFVGWVNFKPLAKTNGKYGKLKLGAGVDAGNRQNSFCVTGGYIGYEYKRFMANLEWAYANGYNGPSGFSSQKHATGFYTTLGYMLTNKLQLIARYDEFDPNKDVVNNNKREITAGINYFLKGQGMKLILDYIFCQNDSTQNSHKILLGTQILL